MGGVGRGVRGGAGGAGGENGNRRDECAADECTARVSDLARGEAWTVKQGCIYIENVPS